MAAITWSAFLIPAFLIFLTNVIECCLVRNASLSLEAMVYDTPFILFGQVNKRITPDPRTPKISTSYGVEFRISCIYKGDSNAPLLKDKDVVTIAGAGVVKDDCYTFQVDDSVDDYVVFLKEDGGHLVSSYGTTDNELSQDVWELVVVCGLNPVGPRGQPVDHEMCPASNAKPDCVEYPPPTTPSPTVKVVTLSRTTKAPKPTTKMAKPTTKKIEKGAQGSGTTAGPGNTASKPVLNAVLSLCFCLLSAIILS